ncbi:MAG: UDP-N-acetylmuramoyl-L-alanine--D-glutamate ligase, partial [Opitutales bacterium]|nr:UDP-N-acetylmuramoyl-L-alanine--D-glutamate ligase [Opitutales bacterium]
LAGECKLEAIAVCEISSFQAEQMSSFQADHVLWTNFDEDHLDRHQSMQSYFRSKYNLIANARGKIALVGRSVYDFGKRIGVDIPESSVVEDERDVESLGIVGTEFETVPERWTYLMARAMWLALKLPEVDLIRAAFSFHKSPHRIELVGDVGGVQFWNDSKATNFHAVYGALERFEEPVFWIGGGKDKGGDLEAFVRLIAPNIKAAAVVGETKERLREAFENEPCVAYAQPSMEAAVRLIAEMAKTGDNVLLSPGFASFDMFKGYAERGEVFRKVIDCLQSERSMKDV